MFGYACQGLLAMIKARPSIESDVREFAVWRYDPPYDAYSFTEDVDQSVDYFLDPSINCHTMVESGAVVGFCTFGRDAQVPGGDYSMEAVDVGLGVRPDLTGSGLGSRFVDTAITAAIRSFDPTTLRVTIAAGNARARRVWGKAGFVERSRFEAGQSILGSRSFVILTRAAQQRREHRSARTR